MLEINLDFPNFWGIQKGIDQKSKPQLTNPNSKMENHSTKIGNAQIRRLFLEQIRGKSALKCIFPFTNFKNKGIPT